MRPFGTPLVVWSLACGLAVSPLPGADARAQSAALGHPAYAPLALTQMAATWAVIRRMRPSADAAPVELPAAVAHRRPIGDAYLEEQRAPATTTGAPSTRTAFLDHNAVERSYEHVSLETRAPQQRRDATTTRGADVTTAIELAGGRFVAAQWGGARDVACDDRFAFVPVIADPQTVRRFLTPAGGGRAFVAFQYDDARLRRRPHAYTAAHAPRAGMTRHRARPRIDPTPAPRYALRRGGKRA